MHLSSPVRPGQPFIRLCRRQEALQVKQLNGNRVFFAHLLASSFDLPGESAGRVPGKPSLGVGFQPCHLLPEGYRFINLKVAFEPTSRSPLKVKDKDLTPNLTGLLPHLPRAFLDVRVLVQGGFGPGFPFLKKAAA